MARIRSVKPEFWEDEIVASLSIPARLLYIATWNVADDEGLLRWVPSYLKSVAFIYDDDIGVDEVQGWMDEIATAELVHPYKGGKNQQRLGWIVSFLRHQKPNRPQPSKFPPPPLDDPDVRRRYGERDLWICQACGKPIKDATDVGFALLKPRNEGGTAHPANISAGHRACAPFTESFTESLSESFTESFTAVVEGSGVVGTVPPVDNVARLQDIKQNLSVRGGKA